MRTSKLTAALIAAALKAVPDHRHHLRGMVIAVVLAWGYTEV
jgi:hypothetical protein